MTDDAQDTMLVRVQGGDVVRRRIASVENMEMSDGARARGYSLPELKDNEALLVTLGDSIPTIVRTGTG